MRRISFAPVFQKNSGGVDRFDLSGKLDHAFTFDFDRSYKQDHLFFYRPGGGLVTILMNDGNSGLRTVFSGGNGIAGFDMSNAADRAFAFDYEGSGRLDYVCLYRPGTGLITIAWNWNGDFRPVFQSNTGVGGYDLKNTVDRAFAFDFE